MHGGVKWRLDKCSSALPLDWNRRNYKIHMLWHAVSLAVTVIVIEELL